MNAFLYKNHSDKNSLTKEVLIGLLIMLLGIIGIISIASISRNKAAARVEQRAKDLQMLKVALEEYKLYHGTYPSSGFSTSKLTQGYDKVTYPNDRWNECDKINSWIPSIAIVLPHDPANSCKYEKNPYPRYEYISDGYNYKILSYTLVGEICDKEEYKEFIDPARPCDRYDASWAVYSFGARNW